MRDEELRALADAATPGPWVADDTTGVYFDDTDVPVSTGWFREGPGKVDVGDYQTLTFEDCAFIAAARTEVPRLLDENAALRKALADLADDVEGLTTPVLHAISTLTKLRSYVAARAALSQEAATTQEEAGA